MFLLGLMCVYLVDLLHGLKYLPLCPFFNFRLCDLFAYLRLFIYQFACVLLLVYVYFFIWMCLFEHVRVRLFMHVCLLFIDLCVRDACVFVVYSSVSLGPLKGLSCYSGSLISWVMEPPIALAKKNTQCHSCALS